MKIRAKKKKSSRYTAYEFDDFLLKELSKDKELFIPDLELSCNECTESECLENTDSPFSF